MAESLSERCETIGPHSVEDNVNPEQAILRLNDDDNVGVALETIPTGASVLDTGYRCRAPIPEGHKISLRAILKDQPSIKFGHPIGFASGKIEPGRRWER